MFTNKHFYRIAASDDASCILTGPSRSLISSVWPLIVARVALGGAVYKGATLLVEQ
jgi:hypothetical protein